MISLIVVCPKGVKTQWASHLQKCCEEIALELKVELSLFYPQRFNIFSYGQDQRKDIADIELTLKEDVKLFIVDEAHRLRNATSFYELLRDVTYDLQMAGSSPRFLLLTATPINNSFTDLKNLFNLTLPPSYWAKRKISDIGLFLKTLDADFGDKLTKKTEADLALLKNALGDLMIRRDQEFLKDKYGAEILAALKIPAILDMSDGKSRISASSDLFDERAEEVSIAMKGIKFFAYQLALAYDERAEDKRKELYRSVQGMLRSHLSKIVQSSLAAAIRSLDNMVRNCHLIMERGDRCAVNRLPCDIEDTDDDPRSVEDSPDALRISSDELERHRETATSDIQRMIALRGLFAEIQSEVDGAKAQALLETLRPDDRTLIFTEYRVTAEWLIDYLRQHADGLRIFPGKPDMLEHDTTCTDELLRLDPSADSKFHREDPNYDVYVLTDRYSEGTNLHKCNRLVHYDWPWNPIRKTQRQGRIVRIDSPHSVVRIDSIFLEQTHMREFADPESVLRTKLSKLSAIVGQGANSDINDEGTQFRSSFVTLYRTSLGDVADKKAQALGSSSDGSQGILLYKYWNELSGKHLEAAKEILSVWDSVRSSQESTIVLKNLENSILACLEPGNGGLQLKWHASDESGELHAFATGDVNFCKMQCSGYEVVQRVEEELLSEHSLVPHNSEAVKAINKIRQILLDGKRTVGKDSRERLLEALRQNYHFRPVDDVKAIVRILRTKKNNELLGYVEEVTHKVQGWAKESSVWVAVCSDGYMSRKDQKKAS